jgi:hypothetical protein
MEDAGHDALIAGLTRRALIDGAGRAGLAALVLSALPVAEAALDAAPAIAAVQDPDGTLQAFADTMIPGRKVAKTDLGHEVHPLAIAGVDDLPGAVEADVLALYHDGRIGFDALAPAFLADLELRSLSRGGDFLRLSFGKRVAVCKEGLAFTNPLRVIWEAAAAVPFTAFCAAATQVNATSRRASGYRVMGLPGTAPNGYRSFSYRRKLSRERTKKGYLP